ncbi:MAG: hypothetical protein OXJ62_07625 [Spirochaetaceae bacterium]|nr:hypothetical protein [Spirochaetaceae bacterium]
MTRETAARVRDAVVEAIDPLEIILFGSVAKATSGPEAPIAVHDARFARAVDRAHDGGGSMRSVHPSASSTASTLPI